VNTATLDPGRCIDTDLVARATALQPLLAANAEATENNRQAHPDNIAAIEAAGLFDLIVPKRVGGIGTSLATQLAVAAELGAACPSTAWVQTLLNVATWATSRSSGKCQDEIWGGGQRGRVFGVLAPTGTAAPVDGGFMVNGSWGFASGGFHGNWAGGGVFVLDAEGNVLGPGMATMAIAEVTIEDTWHVAGMQGTASNTVVANGVFVPTHRLGMGLDLNDTNGAPAEPSDRWPLGSVLALILTGPLLGAARAIADTVAAKAPARAISYTTYFTTDSSAVAVTELARGRLDIETAWLHAFNAAAYVDSVGAGAARDIGEEARLRGSCGYLTDHLRLGVERLLNVAGAGAFAKSNPIQRLWRDVNVGSRHAFLATNPSLETYGRSLLGQDPIYLVT
jgi:3-hydroxy-9,10-secoandrosta-1,3,5(10)-triene-9,17-dione monooxygenase